MVCIPGQGRKLVFDFKAIQLPSLSWRMFRVIGKPLLLLAGLIFLVLFIIQHWEESSRLFSQLNGWFFALSILIALGDNLVSSRIFYWLIRKHDLEAAYRVVGEMFFFGQLAKYIPGRFWGFLYQTTYFKKTTALKSLFMVNMELTGVTIWRNICVGVSLVLFSISSVSIVVPLLLGVAGFYYLVKTHWLRAFTRFLTRKRTSDDAYNQARRRITIYNSPTLLKTTGAFSLTLSLYLLANFLLLVGAFDFPVTDSILFIAFFSFAWIAGVVAFVLPAGIGVRELVFVFLASMLGSNYSLETLATIAIIYRFWQVFHEIGAVGLGLYFRRFSQ